MNGWTKKEAAMMEMRVKMSEQSAEHQLSCPYSDFPMRFLRSLKNDHICLFVAD